MINILVGGSWEDGSMDMLPVSRFGGNSWIC